MNFKEHKNHGIAAGITVMFTYAAYNTFLAYYPLEYTLKYAINSLSFFVLSLILSSPFGLVCFFMSLAPDLDIDSIPSKWYARVAACYISLVMLTDFVFTRLEQHVDIGDAYRFAAGVSLIFMLSKSGKHRGVTHAIGVIFICFVLAFYLKSWLMLSVGAGLFTHVVICDRISPFKLKNWV